MSRLANWRRARIFTSLDAHETPSRLKALARFWLQERDLNPRRTAYETVLVPLQSTLQSNSRTFNVGPCDEARTQNFDQELCTASGLLG